MPGTRPNAIIAAMLLLAPASAHATADQGLAAAFGTWINPKGSVKVATSSCGGMLCGHVVWANARAIADARAAGVGRLVGMALLRDYRPLGNGRWQGRVYVPDMGRTYYSTIRLTGPASLKISGCVLGGLLCKSQIWQRA